MAMQQPGWVVSDLMDVLGLGESCFGSERKARGWLTRGSDKETVETMIAPDLVRYTNETRLRSHLQVSIGLPSRLKTLSTRREPNLIPIAGLSRPFAQGQGVHQPLCRLPIPQHRLFVLGLNHTVSPRASPGETRQAPRDGRDAIA